MRSTQPDRDGTRQVSGSVSAAGAVISSTASVSVSKTGTGTYLVRFPGARGFLSALTSLMAAGAGYTATLTTPGPDTIQVLTFQTQNFVVTDQPFGFQVTFR